MKKSLSLLVAIAMVFSMFATLVSADEKTAGEKLQGYGIINGTSEGLSEDEEWVRKDVAVLVARLLGQVEEASTHANTHGFEDLDSKFYNGYVSWAKENKFFVGQSATKFAPNAPITNQEFAVVLLRVLNALEEKTEDVDYSTAFEAAVELGLVSEDLDKKDNAIRGNIYSALVTSLDYKVGGKKIGNILGLADYAVIDLELVSAGAIVAGSINLKFNDEVATLANTDVTVADINGTNVLVEKVTVSSDAAVVSLAQSLTDGAKYVVTVKNATSKDGSVLESATAEFEYKKAVPASIAFKSNTIAVGASLEVVVKDAAGNDITANYQAGDYNVVSSAFGVVNTSLQGATAGTSVVNVTIKNTDVTTGNQIIYVKNALSASIDEVTLGTIGSGAVSNSVKGVDSSLKFTLKNHAGAVVAPDAGSVAVKSLNPTIVAVDAATINTSTPSTGVTVALKNLQVGSATIVIDAKVDGIAVSKSFVVTVRDASAFTDVVLDKTSVTVVKGSGLTETVKITLKDQYGDNFKVAGAVTPVVEVTTASVIDAATASTINAAGSESSITIGSAAANNTGSTNVTVKVTIGDKTISKSLVAYVVGAAAENGYVVESSAGANLDYAQHATDASKHLGAKETVVKIFKKDLNGNKIADVTSLFSTPVDINNGTLGNQAKLELVNNNGVVAIKTLNTVEAKAPGTESVKVIVNGVHIGTLTFNVDGSAADIIKNVNQAKTSISVKVNDNVSDALTGNANGQGGAFEATNRYGDAVKVSLASADVISTNSAVVGFESGVLKAKAAGTVQLTVKINGAFYVINVNVTN